MYCTNLCTLFTSSFHGLLGWFFVSGCPIPDHCLLFNILDICEIPGYVKEVCYGPYSMSGEDTLDYCVGWKPFPCSPTDLVFLFSPTAWKFTSGSYFRC